MRPELPFEIGFITIASSVLAVVVCGCVFWIGWFSGKKKRNLCGDVSTELITRLPQPVPRWTVFDFLFMFGVMILVGSLLNQSIRQDEKPQAEPTPAVTVQLEVDTAPVGTEPAADAPNIEAATELKPEPDLAAKSERLVTQVQIHFVANLAAFVFTLIVLRFAHGASLAHLSLIPNRDDVRRGLVATVWILAPVLLLNLVVSNLVQYEHTVTDLLAEESGARTFAALLFSAAFVTPIVEEFQFRLLLQGGLQRLADSRTSDDLALSWEPKSAWPIYATSLLFALMHLGQGAAPIPLFFLSVGLGFLYQRTGRLFPAIIVHMLLNGATLSMEFCRVNAGF